MQVPRRTVLAAGLGVLLSGCATSAGNGPTPLGRTLAATPTPARTPAHVATSGNAAVLPPVQRWLPSPGDREPACKLAAVRHVERAGIDRNHTLEVIDAQYGGLLSDTASVLVVTRSWSILGGVLAPGGATYDVRLSRQGSRWRVDAVHPSRPGAPGTISDVARKVLDQNRIILPPAARRDVLSGQVHDAPLAALLLLARDYRIGVSVVRSGHPLYVFGTTRPSDHPRGRAFDTWQIDGRAVVDPRTSRQLVTEYMHAAAAAGSYNVGGPYLLGSAPQWFSDTTHHDHVHAGFLA